MKLPPQSNATFVTILPSGEAVTETPGNLLQVVGPAARSSQLSVTSVTIRPSGEVITQIPGKLPQVTGARPESGFTTWSAPSVSFGMLSSGEVITLPLQPAPLAILPPGEVVNQAPDNSLSQRSSALP